MRNLRLASSLLLACSAAGLGCADAGAPWPATSSAEQPIVGGTLDTTHQAVVLVAHSQGACTGTIIHVDGVKQAGYVLTAAHCVYDQYNNPVPASDFYVVQGDDYNSWSVVNYPVVKVTPNPNYNGDAGGGWDFAMLQIGSVQAGVTPVIPVLKKADNYNWVQGSTSVLAVGYGKTSDADNSNTQRRKVTKIVTDIVTDGAGNAGLIGWSQDDVTGTCQGDSGGPGLVVVGGVEKVGGVTSFGAASCESGFGYQGVPTLAEQWIQGFIDGSGAVDPVTCDQCQQISLGGSGACADEYAACLNHADCYAMLECFQSCADGDDTCVSNCFDAHPTGTTVYGNIGDCICADGCATQCASEPLCQGAACGFAGDDACATCFTSKCCAKMAACADDAVCVDCMTDSQATGCENNAPYKTALQCLLGQCPAGCAANPCAISYGQAEADCDACLQQSCCSVALACVNDTTCFNCLYFASSPACDSNPAMMGFDACINGNCDAECPGGGSGAGGGGPIGTGGSTSTGGGGGPIGAGGSGAGGAPVGVGGGQGTGNTGPGVWQGGPGAEEEEEEDTPAAVQDSGCGCRTAGSTPAGRGGALALFALGAALALGRRRER